MVFSYFYVNTNPSCSSTLSFQYLLNRCARLQLDPIIFNICKFNSKYSHWCLFHSSQVVFVFSTLPSFLFEDSDFLIKYPFYSCEVSSFFSFNVLIRWFPMKMLNSFKFIILHSLFFSSGFNSSFGVDHISSFCFTYLPMWISYPRLSYLFTLPSSYECWRYLERFVFPFSISK